MKEICSIRQGEKRSMLIRAESWKVDCIDCSVGGGGGGWGQPVYVLRLHLTKMRTARLFELSMRNFDYYLEVY